MIAVEFPVEEAVAILKRLEESESMSGVECDSAEQGRRRLKAAVLVETGSGGAHADALDLGTIAERLIGERVSVTTIAGRQQVGELRRISGFRTLVLGPAEGDPPHYHYPINLGLITAIARAA